MPGTYDSISTYTIPSITNTYTFSSIPQTYTDLIVILGYGIHTAGGESLFMRFNGDTTSNYSNERFVSGGGGLGAYNSPNEAFIYVGVLYTSTDPLTHISHINNYTNSTTFKTVICRQNTTNNIAAHVGLWRKSPEPITSITLYTPSGNFGVGSTFSLYGIKAA